LTEDQARKKRCPILDRECLASDCMWWRWDVVTVREENDKIFPFGYCGPAGEEK